MTRDAHGVLGRRVASNHQSVSGGGHWQRERRSNGRASDARDLHWRLPVRELVVAHTCTSTRYAPWRRLDEKTAVINGRRRSGHPALATAHVAFVEEWSSRPVLRVQTHDDAGRCNSGGERARTRPLRPAGPTGRATPLIWVAVASARRSKSWAVVDASI